MDPNTSMRLTGVYDYRLVALSIALAIGASYAALDLAGRVTAARDWSRKLWLAGGAAAMGLGIWAMHYIGMLAVKMPMPVLYDAPTVGLSLLAAVVASAAALFIVSRETMGRWTAAIGSVTMGGGIAAMHYIGMAAMRVPAEISYDLRIVAFSIALGIIVSLIALQLTFRVRDEQRTSLRKVISALVMGSAIPLIHYAGMAAVRFSPSSRVPEVAHAVGISNLGIAAIASTSLLVLMLAMFTSFLDRLLLARRKILEVARESEEHFRVLAEAIPQMIWTSGPDGEPDYVNRQWRDYTGLDLERCRGGNWKTAVHPDDQLAGQRRWEHAVARGDVYEIEQRVQRARDGMYRWQLARALPIRGANGNVIRWFGTYTDIDDQKHNQQILEKQIKEQTEELVVANRQLKREMAERQQVQSELDQRNAAMLEELTRRSERAILLSQMGKLLQSCQTMDEAIAIIPGFAPRIFPEFCGALMLLDASRTMLEVTSAWSGCDVPNAPAVEANSCWALRTGDRHLVEAGDETAPCGHAGKKKSAYLCVPITTPAGTVGVLHLQAIGDERNPFESQLFLVSSLAQQVGLSISNLRLQEVLKQQSIRDTLTGLYNRRHLNETLEREIRRAARSDQPVGLIMFDLDHFKVFNDTFGHEAGDRVLRAVGDCLLRYARAEDVPCRFGGEEFVMILPGSKAEGAQSRAERLRMQIKEMNVIHEGREVGTITISVGVAAFPTHGLSIKDLLVAADTALYQAKKGGRDRVVAAEVMSTHESDATVAGIM
jgi:diguanylate cyclase (GGDEF)-like protein/PAS domain S-box-containing protein